MFLRISFILTVLAIVAEAGNPKPKTPPTRPTPTTTESTTTPLCTTPTPSPTYPTIYPLCCGKNEVYLPPRIAPPCDVYCEDIGKECIPRYDILEPVRCFCLPGSCRNKWGDCITFYEAFVKCRRE